MRYSIALAALGLVAAAAPAVAQDAPTAPFKVTGSVGLVNEYRFRGISQSDRDLAVQGGLTIAHESGFYIGTWGSNLSGWGTFGGSNMELDLIAGFKTNIGNGGAIDVGATWYMYPGGFDNTDFIEPYAKLSGTVGPASLTAGVAYAPKQQALGAWYFNGLSAFNDANFGTGYDDPNDKNDNLYLWGDGSVAVPNTGLTAKAHIGYSNGNKGLGPFATSVAPTGEYWDWSAGVDYTIPGMPLTVGVSYVDTDITNREAAYLQPSFSRGQDGAGSIAKAAVLFSLTASF